MRTVWACPFRTREAVRQCVLSVHHKSDKFISTGKSLCSSAQGRGTTNNDTHTRTPHTWLSLSCHLPYSAVAHKVQCSRHALLPSVHKSCTTRQQQSALYMFSQRPACIHQVLGTISSTGSKHSKLQLILVRCANCHKSNDSTSHEA